MSLSSEVKEGVGSSSSSTNNRGIDMPSRIKGRTALSSLVDCSGRMGRVGLSLEVRKTH